MPSGTEGIEQAERLPGCPAFQGMPRRALGLQTDRLGFGLAENVSMLTENLDIWNADRSIAQSIVPAGMTSK
jgi:hypothetical protein